MKDNKEILEKIQFLEKKSDKLQEEIDNLYYSNNKLKTELQFLWKKLRKIVILSLINLIILFLMLFSLPENVMAFLILLFTAIFIINLIYIFKFSYHKFIE